MKSKISKAQNVKCALNFLAVEHTWYQRLKYPLFELTLYNQFIGVLHTPAKDNVKRKLIN